MSLAVVFCWFFCWLADCSRVFTRPVSDWTSARVCFTSLRAPETSLLRSPMSPRRLRTCDCRAALPLSLLFLLFKATMRAITARTEPATATALPKYDQNRSLRSSSQIDSSGGSAAGGPGATTGEGGWAGGGWGARGWPGPIRSVGPSCIAGAMLHGGGEGSELVLALEELDLVLVLQGERDLVQPGEQALPDLGVDFERNL